MKNNWAYILLFSMLFMQACSPYQKSAVSLHASVDKGKVLVETNFNQSYQFDEVLYEEGKYYGLHDSVKISIAPENVDEVYLTKTKNYVVWIKQSNSDKVSKGVLDSIMISGVYIMVGNESKYIETEFIESIRYREKNKAQKQMAVGAIIGYGVGAATGLIIGDTDNEILGSSGALKGFGFFGPLFALAGGTWGGIKGLKKEAYTVNHDVNSLMRLKQNLK